MGVIDRLDLGGASDAGRLAHALRAVLVDAAARPDRIKTGREMFDRHEPGYRTPDTFIDTDVDHFQIIVTDHEGPLSDVIALARQMGEEKARDLLRAAQPQPPDDEDEDEDDDDEDPPPAGAGPRGPVTARFSFYLPN